jgi:phosphopantetheinyl transferase (holo-ACP synthase)
MTVCGVGEKVVSRVLDDRLADRLSGRLALRQAYRDFRQGRSELPADPAIAHRPSGQPYVQVGSGLYCSISHCHRVGVAAVALSAVGIDIERIRPREPRLLDYVADEKEAAALRGQLGSTAELMTLLWTLKEATAKMSGRGLGVALRRLRVTATGHHTFDVDGCRAVSYRYKDFYIGLAFEQSAQGRPAIRWYQPRRLSAAEIAQDAGGLETVQADSFQRQVSG